MLNVYFEFIILIRYTRICVYVRNYISLMIWKFTKERDLFPEV